MILRFNFEQWKKKHPQASANFKKDFKTTLFYTDATEEASGMVRSIFELPVVSKRSDEFNAIPTDALMSLTIDFNDHYYLELCARNNWILVTTDGDFGTISRGVTIVRV